MLQKHYFYINLFQSHDDKLLYPENTESSTNTLQWLFVRKLCCPLFIFYIYIFLILLFILCLCNYVCIYFGIDLCFYAFFLFVHLCFYFLFISAFIYLQIFLHGKYFFMPLEIYLGQKISMIVYEFSWFKTINYLAADYSHNL